jgi:hypothetical protein
VIINKYLGKFSAEGKPEGFLLEGINYKTAEEKAQKMREGYNVELTQEEWEYYTNNRGYGDNGTGYIRDPQTGKPVSAPPRVYTKTELANMANGQAQSEIAEINNQIIIAQANNDMELVSELNAEKAAVTERYAAILAKIESGEITEPDQIAPAEEA